MSCIHTDTIVFIWSLFHHKYPPLTFQIHYFRNPCAVISGKENNFDIFLVALVTSPLTTLDLISSLKLNMEYNTSV